jgi:hypothetical protein
MKVHLFDILEKIMARPANNYEINIDSSILTMISVGKFHDGSNEIALFEGTQGEPNDIWKGNIYT